MVHKTLFYLHHNNIKIDKQILLYKAAVGDMYQNERRTSKD